MDIPAGVLPASWHWVAWAVYLPMMLVALWRAPWFKLDSEALNVFLGAVVCLLVLWTMRAGVLPGLNFHLIGATALCLMFDWAFALLAMTLVVAGSTFWGHGSWDTLAINLLLMGAVPIVITRTMLTFAQRRLPYNYFIYVFFNTYLAASLSNAAVGLLATALHAAAGSYSPHQLYETFLPFFLLTALPEGIFNGVVMSGVVAYRPRWVATFDDARYLNGK
jgi:uncharacterized membrane protein